MMDDEQLKLIAFRYIWVLLALWTAAPYQLVFYSSTTLGPMYKRVLDLVIRDSDDSPTLFRKVLMLHLSVFLPYAMILLCTPFLLRNIKPLKLSRVSRWFLDSTFIFMGIVVQKYEDKYLLLLAVFVCFHLITLVNLIAPCTKLGVFECLLICLLQLLIPHINDGTLSLKVVWIILALYQGLKQVDEAFVQVKCMDDDKSSMERKRKTKKKQSYVE